MSNQLSATGQILKIGQVEQVSDKFRKRELIIKTEAESQLRSLRSASQRTGSNLFRCSKTSSPTVTAMF